MIPASGHCKLIKMPACFGLLVTLYYWWGWYTPCEKRDNLTLITDWCKNSSKLIFLKIDVKPCLECYSVHYHHSTGFPHCTAKCSCALGDEAELSLELHSSGLNCTDSSYLVKMWLLFTFPTAFGFNPEKIAGFKPSPALFILQKIAYFSTQPYFKE